MQRTEKIKAGLKLRGMKLSSSVWAAGSCITYSVWRTPPLALDGFKNWEGTAYKGKPLTPMISCAFKEQVTLEVSRTIGTFYKYKNIWDSFFFIIRYSKHCSNKEQCPKVKINKSIRFEPLQKKVCVRKCAA